MTLQTKLKVYIAIGVTTLFYDCETWTVYCKHAMKLNIFHINCLRRSQTRRSSSVVGKAFILSWRKLNFDGLTMHDHTGGQRKRYKDSVKSSPKDYWSQQRVLGKSSRWTRQWKGAMNKPGYARRKKRDCSAKPVLREKTFCEWKYWPWMPDLRHNLSCPNRPYQPYPETSHTCDIPVTSWSTSSDGWTNKKKMFLHNRRRAYDTTFSLFCLRSLSLENKYLVSDFPTDPTWCMRPNNFLWVD